MGHATRSRVVLEHLLEAGHEVVIVVSGRAEKFLTNVLAHHDNARVIRIGGLTLSYAGNTMKLGASVRQNRGQAPRKLARNVAVYAELLRTGFRPELVMSDFESLAYLYGMLHDVPGASLTTCRSSIAAATTRSSSAISEEGFIDDLRSARAVIAGGGFSLMGEAVHLGVPMLSFPIEGQFEQELNARYLAALGYGACARKLSADVVERFLDAVPSNERALSTCVRHDNTMLMDNVDELIDRVARGEAAPHRSSAPALAKSPSLEVTSLAA